MHVIAECADIFAGQQEVDFKIHVMCVLAPISGIIICNLSKTAVNMLKHGKVNKDFLHLRFE